MKTISSLILFLLTCINAHADHVLGGELLYEHINGDKYTISLTMYGECSGGSFYHLKNAQPRIKIYNELGAFFNLILYEDVTQRQEVSNVCPAEAPKTTCKSPAGTVPGVTRFVYTAEVDLPPAADWRFLFGAQMDHTGKLQSGFSNQISNIKNNTGFGFYLILEAMLNNLHTPNSSPEYTAIATPYYCINTQQQYTPGAVDKDNDNLKFTLIPPYDIDGITTTYNAPYTPTLPFSAVQGTFNYNNANGQMSFVPNKTEAVLIVHKTEEFRNEALVGSTMRAMTFFMRNNCNNEAPYGSIDPNTVSGAIPDNNTVNTCKDENIVKFKIPIGDKNGNNVHVTLSNIPQGASAIINNNHTQHPEIDFEWDVTGVAPYSYVFYANYNDGACPTPGNHTIAYTVNITYPIAVFHEVLKPTNCKYKQHIQFHLDGGILPRKVTVTDSNGRTVKTYEDYTGSIQDSFAVGKYKISAHADYLPCSTSYNFEVTDYGIYPYPPLVVDKNYCLNDPVQELQPTPTDSSSIQWFDMQGNRLAFTPVYNTDEIRHYQWRVNQKVKVCESVYDTLDIHIHPHPTVDIESIGGHACIGDEVLLLATGASRYEWQPPDKVIYKDGNAYASVHKPETFTVTGYSRVGCTGTDTLIFDDIEKCCLFSYPTAFTPNADGLNDGWHPITYGNVDQYQLSIYNRWGERVYISRDPHQRWDGRHGGIPCDIGTYYYRLKAHCITGSTEETGGSFLLLR